MKLLFVCALSFAVTYAVIPVIVRLAKRFNCLDAPGKRRFHAITTPKWGGAAFLISVVPALPFITGLNSVVVSFAAASFFLVAVGLLDDYRPLGWKTKFAGIAIAATIVIAGGGVVVHEIGYFPGSGPLDLGPYAVPFTYFGILGVTNAVNLLDGLNGLAGGVSLISFFFLGLIAALNGNVLVAAVSFSFVGALAAFLRYNFPRAQVFMGDSGSLFLGFSLAVLSIRLTQDGNHSVDAMYPVLVLLLPLFDTLRVFLVRIMRGKNPFQADKSHLHHLLVRKGISPVTAVLLLWGMTALAGVTAVSLREQSSFPFLIAVFYSSLWLSVLAFALAWRRKKKMGSASVPVNAVFLHATGMIPSSARRDGPVYSMKVKSVLKREEQDRSIVIRERSTTP